MALHDPRTASLVYIEYNEMETLNRQSQSQMTVSSGTIPSRWISLLRLALLDFSDFIPQRIRPSSAVNPGVKPRYVP